ncbi:hypothetical protein M5689_017897 [Euphorbia peplus]|nr:hypothetical protein M5689_017897 [Euphorbia peplus]
MQPPRAGYTVLPQPPMGPPEDQPQQVPPSPFMMMPQQSQQWNPSGESSMQPPQLPQYYLRPQFPILLPYQTRDPLMDIQPPPPVPPHLLSPYQHYPEVSQAEYAKREKRRMEWFSPMSPLDFHERRKRLRERLSKDAVCLGSLHRPDGSVTSDDKWLSMLHNAWRHKHAKKALEFYEKSQDTDFEMVDALYSDHSLLAVPGADDLQEWCHVSFIAKPKDTDCNDASPKYFFAELLRAKRSTTFNVKYCSTFEPSDDPGFEHCCVFCPADQKFHPGVDGYRIGGPQCSVVRMRFG